MVLCRVRDRRAKPQTSGLPLRRSSKVSTVARSGRVVVGQVHAQLTRCLDLRQQLLGLGLRRGDGVGAGDEPRRRSSGGLVGSGCGALRGGFYLVNSIEVDARAGVTAGDVARLWSLAVRTDAEAVFVLGLDDGRAVLDPMADELSGLARKFAGGRDPAARSLRQLRRRPRHRSRPPYLNDPTREPDPRRTSERDH
jgi:hypothetical protein